MHVYVHVYISLWGPIVTYGDKVPVPTSLKVFSFKLWFLCQGYSYDYGYV